MEALIGIEIDIYSRSNKEYYPLKTALLEVTEKSVEERATNAKYHLDHKT